MPDVELKPCPFCGSKEIMHYDQPSQADDRTLWSCFCIGCQVHGPRKYTLEDAESAWNNRLSAKAINIIFDGPPGPEAGRFVEVETDDGKSINAGDWKQRDDRYWALRITGLPV